MSRHIHLDWDGPYTYEDALKLTDPTDKGLYQIYGAHPVYGAEVLLYIGKTTRLFGHRLSEEGWRSTNPDAANLKIYVGRLSGTNGTPSAESWLEEITIAETFLIYAHWPAGNSSGLNVNMGKDFHDIHILNWGQHRSLLPEVSGARYSDRFCIPGWGYYGEN